MVPDISEIAEFVYTWDFDSESYEEYLQDNELERNEETLLEYIRDNVSFEMEFLDNETLHVFCRETMSLDEISEEFGDKLANAVLTDCSERGEGRFETCYLFDDDIDVNNKEQVNDMAKKLLQHGDYYKNCRGFILSDGTVIYTPNEHNQCTVINGVKNTFHFIQLGNIRLLPNSIDIGQKPTMEQRNVLRQVISCYSNDELYLDIMDKGSEISAKYTKPNWRYVMGEIDRYYEEGIKPTGRDFYEAKKPKTVIITEEEEQNLIGNILQEAFYPNSDKVLLIKDFLDKNFAKQEIDSLDENGYPTKEKTVMLLSNNKQPLKTLSMKELLRFLDDKFQKMVSKKEDRRKFLKQVIKDWYFGNIKGNGILTVNYL